MTEATRSTRRDFLQNAAAGLTGVAALDAATGPAMPADDAPTRSYVDAHSHIWTRDVANYPLATGVTLDNLQPPSFTIAELLATCQPVGVGRVVLIAHSGFYRYDNSYLTDAYRQHPDVFRVVAMIDAQKPRPDQMLRDLVPLGVTGFRITPFVDGDDWLQRDGMQVMWRTAAHTGQSMCCLIAPHHLAAVDAMCERFPDTPVVIDHFARIGIDGQMRDSDIQQLCRLARHRHSFVKLSAFYALGRKQPPHDELIPMIRRVLDAFGPSRCMWASDAPYQLTGGNNYAASLALIRDRLEFLSAADREWLLTKTAAAVFFR